MHKRARPGLVADSGGGALCVESERRLWVMECNTRFV